MKKIVERSSGFKWVDGNTSGPIIQKDSDAYRALIAKGCKVELIPKAEKDAHKIAKDTEKSNSIADSYLKNTDWLVIRELDSGEKMPEEIKVLRQEAREQIKAVIR